MHPIDCEQLKEVTLCFYLQQSSSIKILSLHNVQEKNFTAKMTYEASNAEVGPSGTSAKERQGVVMGE